MINRHIHGVSIQDDTHLYPITGAFNEEEEIDFIEIFFEKDPIIIYDQVIKIRNFNFGKRFFTIIVGFDEFYVIAEKKIVLTLPHKAVKYAKNRHIFKFAPENSITRQMGFGWKDEPLPLLDAPCDAYFFKNHLHLVTNFGTLYKLDANFRVIETLPDVYLSEDSLKITSTLQNFGKIYIFYEMEYCKVYSDGLLIKTIGIGDYDMFTGIANASANLLLADRTSKSIFIIGDDDDTFEGPKMNDFVHSSAIVFEKNIIVTSSINSLDFPNTYIIINKEKPFNLIKIVDCTHVVKDPVYFSFQISERLYLCSPQNVYEVINVERGEIKVAWNLADAL